ncbi:Gustatory receptor, partial [Gryllus bimaculatus]
AFSLYTAVATFQQVVMLLFFAVVSFNPTSPSFPAWYFVSMCTHVGLLVLRLVYLCYRCEAVVWEIRFFTVQLNAQKLGFTACGFFPINFSLLHSMALSLEAEEEKLSELVFCHNDEGNNSTYVVRFNKIMKIDSLPFNEGFVIYTKTYHFYRYRSVVWGNNLKCKYLTIGDEHWNKFFQHQFFYDK